MKQEQALLLAYYGDDFTGSTDALDFLGKAGIKTVLFIKAPDQADLQKYPDVQAIGVAGMTRSMEPQAMEEELSHSFKLLKNLKPQHVHYKVCSTFDSSPTVGSIGKAIETGIRIFEAHTVPLLVAAPALGRYCTFGNLFARMGIGSQGKIYRLDRHPSMSRHPVTPADESDLRLHLAKQTAIPVELFDVLGLEEDLSTQLQHLEQKTASSGVLLFDAVNNSHIKSIGNLLSELKETTSTLFSVGSSGIEMALGEHWQHNNELPSGTSWKQMQEVEQLLVISGSCSPVTSGQIKKAVDAGFAELELDTLSLSKSGNTEAILDNFIQSALELLHQHQHLIIHTSKGPDDPRIQKFKENNLDSAAVLGGALGYIAKRIIEEIQLKRIVVAGGDTSSYAARAMGIEAVEMLAPFVSGAPWCKAHAPGSAVDQIEINFKGGQVGDEDYFLKAICLEERHKIESKE